MSLYNKTIARRKPFWQITILGMALLLSPFLASALDGNVPSFSSLGNFRPLLLAPVIILYILVISQIMVRTEETTYKKIRQLFKIDDEKFAQLNQEASRLHPVAEILALLIGIVIGTSVGFSWIIEGIWLKVCIIGSLGVMYGLLTWTILCLITGTRLIASLHKQPIEVDIFNIKPFEPIGRYSLIIALVYIIGVVLGLVFGLNLSNILAWQTLLFFIPLLLIGVLLFFLNMKDTHRLLSNEKKRVLVNTVERIQVLNKRIQARLQAGESIADLSSEYLAWTTFESKVRSTSTWPYNTSMLRTLFFSICVPLLIRGLSALLFGH